MEHDCHCKAMTLHIFDNTLRDKRGHHYEYDKSIYDEWTSMGFQAKVYCHQKAKRDIRESLSGMPNFSHDIHYSVSRIPKVGQTINFFLGNLFFWKDLRKIDPKSFSKSDIALFHTLSYNQLLGLFIWYKSLPVENQPFVVLLLRYTNIVFRPQKVWRRSRYLYKFIFKLFSNYLMKYNIVLAADSDILAEEYEELSGVKVSVLPIPHLPHNGNSKHSGKMTSFIYLGDAREEKGYCLLPEAIRGILGERKDIRFVIQSNVSENPSKAVLKTKAELSTIGETVVVVDGPLETEEYYKLLSEADAVLLPYCQSTYYGRTSGIFAEALAFGKPVITTADTWMELQIKKYNNCGVTFNGYNAQELKNAIEVFLNNKKDFSIKAKEASMEWKKFYNARTYIDRLLALRRQ
ncbi:MAG: glycosyltransferase [Bacillota bacterium]